MAKSKPFSSNPTSHGTALPISMAAAPPGKPIPPAAEGTIRGMISEATDAETAGSEGASASAPTSNGALGAYRDALVPPPGYHVP